ncbi:hypothetical protein Hypma_009953 [Hypsizygus marmoreus]|uniref:Uncharacterized protein n=1 Tax=Hypsizygus marmoreus TaxID=39966 RepID=A0A369JPD8_HYPMA|nr:hypothetical protein Hypma_009953 [Hypsizygus marmoreus]
MPRSKRSRSNAAKAAHLQKYLASPGYAKAQEALEHHTTRLSLELNKKHLPSKPKKLRTTITRNFPRLRAENLPKADANDRLLILEKGTKDPLAMRFDRVVNKETAHRLANACLALDQLGPKINHKETTRSKTSALHLGIWEVYSDQPHLTRDTVNQEPLVKETIARLLAILREEVAPKLAQLLQQHHPRQWERQLTAYARVREVLGQQLQEMPWLDFGGAFFTVAVKVGSSERWHIDWNDDPSGGIAWVLPVGVFTGGDFCSPQLQASIPVRQGQVLGVQARRLIHCGLQTTGLRHVFTLFTDYLVLKHAEDEAQVNSAVT